MPNKAPATRTFEELYATESKNPLPTSDDDIVAALANYGAKYVKGASKPRKADRRNCSQAFPGSTSTTMTLLPRYAAFPKINK